MAHRGLRVNGGILVHRGLTVHRGLMVHLPSPSSPTTYVVGSLVVRNVLYRSRRADTYYVGSWAAGAMLGVQM